MPIKSDNKNIRLAIIGCGAVTERAYIPAIIQLDNVETTLLVDKNLERAKELSEKYNIPNISTDYTEVIKYADSAIICVPHFLHAPITIELLNNGINILVEKPMAITKSECLKMIRASEKSKSVLSVGNMRRFLNSCKFAHWILKNEILGKIESFDFREGNIYNWPVKSDFFFKKDSAGGGVLIDTGAHTLDLLLWWLGDYSSLKYYDDSYGGVESDCELHLEMKSGATGIIELSRTRDLRNTAIIKGKKAVIEIDLRNNKLSLSSPDKLYGFAGEGLSQNLVREDQPFKKLFQIQIQDWIDSIHGKKFPSVTGKQVIKSIELIEKCYLQKQTLEMPWVKPITIEI